MNNNNCNAAREALEQLMAADFFVIDLQLYLDTHPCDRQALSLYAKAVEKACVLREEYEKRFGPLTIPAAACNTQMWTWEQAPWPWQL